MLNNFVNNKFLLYLNENAHLLSSLEIAFIIRGLVNLAGYLQ